MKSTFPDFKLRLPQELKDQIEAAARESNRSMNGEIVSRLEFTFAIDLKPEGDTGVSTKHGPGSTEWNTAVRQTQTLEKRINELEARLARLEAR